VVDNLAYFLDVMHLSLSGYNYILLFYTVNFMAASDMTIGSCLSHLQLTFLSHTSYSHVLCIYTWFFLKCNICCSLFFRHVVFSLL
jgi:hypothetical protein